MRIVVFGAGKWGKVVLETLRQEGHEIVGWLDDNKALHGASYWGNTVLGGMDWLLTCNRKNLGAIVAIGYSAARVQVAAKLKAMGVTLVNSIHPSAIVMRGVQLGHGNIVCPAAVIEPGVKVGNCVLVNTAATVGHDSVLEDGAWIAPGVHTGGAVRIGRQAYVSVGALILAGVSIGEGAVVAAGVVVNRHVPPNTIIFSGKSNKVVKITAGFDWKLLASGVTEA